MMRSSRQQYKSDILSLTAGSLAKLNNQQGSNPAVVARTCGNPTCDYPVQFGPLERLGDYPFAFHLPYLASLLIVQMRFQRESCACTDSDFVGVLRSRVVFEKLSLWHF